MTRFYRICETSMMANRCNLLRPDLFDFFQIHVPNKADITSQHITSDLNRLRTSANTHIFPVVEQVRHRRTFSLLSVCLFVLRNFLESCCFPRIKLLQFKKLFVLNECFDSGFVLLCMYEMLLRYRYMKIF